MFNAIEGTAGGQNSDRTDVSYKVGAIGWPDKGLPGRGMEIALHPDKAFSFVQSVLMDEILLGTVVAGDKPLLGYVSIRLCPPTDTVMGMQEVISP